MVLLIESKISLFSIWKSFNATHHINLVVQILFQILIVKHIEDLILVPLLCLSYSLKRHFEFLKLIDLLKRKGSKIL